MDNPQREISLEYASLDGEIRVDVDGDYKKAPIKRDKWGDPDFLYTDLAHVATSLTGGTGKGEYWRLDADEARIEQSRDERSIIFIIRYLGTSRPHSGDGYLQTHYTGSEQMSDAIFLNGNPYNKRGFLGGIVCHAMADPLTDALHLLEDGREQGLTAMLPFYLEFVRHPDREVNETFIRANFSDGPKPEWEPEWF